LIFRFFMQIVSEGWYRGELDGSETRIRGEDLLNSSHSLASATPFSDIIGGRLDLVAATSRSIEAGGNVR
jgi:hypothetical protein